MLANWLAQVLYLYPQANKWNWCNSSVGVATITGGIKTRKRGGINLLNYSEYERNIRGQLVTAVNGKRKDVNMIQQY